MTNAGVAGRRYVVTGSASGIGAATAAILRRRGGEVIGCDLDDADIRADLSTPDGRRALVEQVHEFGSVDAVLAIAGGGRTGLIETNYFGAVATLEGLRPLLAQSDAPRAVVVSSTSSLAPADELVMRACLDGDEAAAVTAIAASPSGGGEAGAYGVAKRALNRWVRTAAPNIRVGRGRYRPQRRRFRCRRHARGRVDLRERRGPHRGGNRCTATVRRLSRAAGVGR